MAIKKYTCPPQPASGAGTFSDDLVGVQLVQGGGFTQGNFTTVVIVSVNASKFVDSPGSIVIISPPL